MKESASNKMSIAIDTKIMLNNIDNTSFDKAFKQKLKHYGNGFANELEIIWNKWINTMEDREMEEVFFYLTKVKELFNDIMTKDCLDLKKMATLKIILEEYQKGALMEADDKAIRMIKSIIPESIKEI